MPKPTLNVCNSAQQNGERNHIGLSGLWSRITSTKALPARGTEEDVTMGSAAGGDENTCSNWSISRSKIIVPMASFSCMEMPDSSAPFQAQLHFALSMSPRMYPMNSKKFGPDPGASNFRTSHVCSGRLLHMSNANNHEQARTSTNKHGQPRTCTNRHEQTQTKKQRNPRNPRHKDTKTQRHKEIKKQRRKERDREIEFPAP